MKICLPQSDSLLKPCFIPFDKKIEICYECDEQICYIDDVIDNCGTFHRRCNDFQELVCNDCDEDLSQSSDLIFEVTIDDDIDTYYNNITCQKCLAVTENIVVFNIITTRPQWSSSVFPISLYITDDDTYEPYESQCDIPAHLIAIPPPLIFTFDLKIDLDKDLFERSNSFNRAQSFISYNPVNLIVQYHHGVHSSVNSVINSFVQMILCAHKVVTKIPKPLLRWIYHMCFNFL